MDYLKGYRVAREDPEWTSKLLIGSLIFLSSMVIPLVGQLALVGWQALIMRRAVHGQDTPMPRLEFDMDYLGKLVGLGFKGLIARFLWSLPVIVLVFGSVMCLYFAFFAMIFGGVAVAAEGGNSGLAALGPVAAMCCMFVGYFSVMVLAIVAAIPANVAAMRAELCDDLAPAMKFGEVMDFTKKNFGELLKGTLILGVVGSILGMIGSFFCFVGVLPVAVLGMVAHAHFLAQVYQQHVQNGGDPLPVAGPELDVPRLPANPPQNF